ncbi:MAG TPA: DUF2911 domain-containing protein [Polyangia bacterium]|jgi:hypothetical protein|nr:DUF2911 domain-containing protein [Polyangia bacterium]
MTRARRCFSSLLIFAFTVLVARASSAQQLELPRPSPGAKVSQTVGLTELGVDYSSPGVKGRKIWGAVVPFDKLWRAGANQPTKVTFSKDVTFGDKAVPAGTYALFVIPTKAAWTVILSKKLDQAGTGADYNAADDMVRISVTPKPAPFRERLAYQFTDFTDEKASLNLEWEKVRLPIPIAVATNQQIMATIGTVLGNSWRPYALAARFMLETKKDYDTGLKYVDQSLALKEDWFNVWIKAELLAAKGDYKQAYGLAEKAQEMGSKGPGFFLADDIKTALGNWKKKI